MAIHCFSPEAAKAVVGATEDYEQLLDEGQIRAMARASRLPYWSDGSALLKFEEWADRFPRARKVSALEAYEKFGLDRLHEAAERGASLE